MLDLDSAATAHIDWLGRLMQALQRNYVSTELRQETSGSTCLFAHWLADQTTLERYDTTALRRIRDLHHSMHELASALLAGMAAEEHFTTLDRFCRTAAEFNRLIVALGRDPGASRHSA